MDDRKEEVNRKEEYDKLGKNYGGLAKGIGSINEQIETASSSFKSLASEASDLKASKDKSKQGKSIFSNAEEDMIKTFERSGDNPRSAMHRTIRMRKRS